MTCGQDVPAPILSHRLIVDVYGYKSEEPAHFPPAAFQLPYRVQAGRLHEARTLANHGAVRTSSFKAI